MIDPSGSFHQILALRSPYCPTRDSLTLASGYVQALLEADINPKRQRASYPSRHYRTHQADGPRESPMGRQENPWRAS